MTIPKPNDPYNPRIGSRYVGALFSLYLNSITKSLCYIQIFSKL